MARSTIIVQPSYRDRPASDVLPGKPIAALYERLVEVLLEGMSAELALPAAPARKLPRLGEQDLPLPPDIPIAEVVDPNGTAGDITVVLAGPYAPGQLGTVMQLVSKACAGTEFSSGWFDVVPPA